MQETVDGAWTGSTRLIPPDSHVDCTYMGSALWLLTGPGVQSSTRLFQAALGASGWQKLPSGLILQWARATFTQGQTVSITLPIVFPNTGLACVACKGTLLNNAGEYSLGADVTHSSISITNTGPNDGLTQGGLFIAIGY